MGELSPRNYRGDDHKSADQKIPVIEVEHFIQLLSAKRAAGGANIDRGIVIESLTMLAAEGESP